MWTLIAIAVSLLLVVVMSGRDAKDVPHARTPRELRRAVRNTHWLRVVLVALWFLLAFLVHFVEGLGWLFWLVLLLGLRLLGWLSGELRGMAAPALLP